MRAVLPAMLLVAGPLRAQDEAPHVVAQLCFPQGAVDTGAALPLDEVGRHSINAVQAAEAGLTTLGQRVVEVMLAEPGYSRFLILGAPGAATVFAVPSRLAALPEAAWRAADFQSAHAELAFLLLSDQRVPDRSAVPEAAPRIRFEIQTFGQFLERVRQRREQGVPADLPPC